MFHLVNTDEMVAQGILNEAQAQEIMDRSRGAMVSLAVNSILCVGILAATLGLIFWLAEPIPVAIFGLIAMAIGFQILKRAGATYAMFGKAAALIGAGLLIGGATFELIENYDDFAGPTLFIGGAAILLLAGLALRRGKHAFVSGAIFLMGLAVHIGGIAFLADEYSLPRAMMPLLYLYTTVAIAGAGIVTNVRFVTAIAIAPFAQMLDTSTFYFHAGYVFYSPEPTLSVLQMSLLVIAMFTLAARYPERIARHARILAIMGFIVANLCALIGSLWGDVVGEHIWGPLRSDFTHDDYAGWSAARDAFRDTALNISEHVFSILWALALVVCIIFAAHKNHRPLFNAALTFGAIHAYTQVFESFYDEPLAWVIGGLAAIPLAWGIWRADEWLLVQQKEE